MGNGEWGRVRGESSVGGEASQITEENDKRNTRKDTTSFGTTSY